ncbi:MAG: MarR family transcriptional regulator [Collinsella sp.]
MRTACAIKETEWNATPLRQGRRAWGSAQGWEDATPAQRDTVFGLHDAGFTVRQIERYTGIKQSTVSRIVARLCAGEGQTGSE